MNLIKSEMQDCPNYSIFLIFFEQPITSLHDHCCLSHHFSLYFNFWNCRRNGNFGGNFFSTQFFQPRLEFFHRQQKIEVGSSLQHKQTSQPSSYSYFAFFFVKFPHSMFSTPYSTTSFFSINSII